MKAGLLKSTPSKVISFWTGLLSVTALCAAISPVFGGEIVLNADFSVHTGRIRALHGINKGPIAPGGIFDLIKEQKELGIPFTRLHDCGWPNPYVVDHHAVFPNPNADPTLPESYDFRLTDEYIQAVRKTGAEPIYRLGESIEHTTTKRYVHPPADMEKWAAICRGIIRHYNKGWANGFEYRIQYWEIWNEPENRPVMWSGTDDDYLRLYRTAATAIKKEFPEVKVGGPALGASGSFVKSEFKATEFADRFLTMCQKENVPLNFFSWHCYTAEVSELASRARAIGRLLDSKGLTETENHLNEWNYLPGNSWAPLSKTAPALARQACYQQMAGAPGAAFVAASLLELQDAPVDVCNFYHGELGGFGVFTDQGVPQKVYQALRAFQSLSQTPRRIETHGKVPGKLGFSAGLSDDGRLATFLISNYSDDRDDIVLNWKGFTWTGGVTAEIRTIDAQSDDAQIRNESLDAQGASIRLKLKAPAIALVRLRPTDANAHTLLSITSPPNRLVYQRDQAGSAIIPIAGECAWKGAAIDARLLDLSNGKAGEWTPIGNVQADSHFSGNLKTAAGWYTLEVKAQSAENKTAATVDRVGVGEVFVVVGHSVAHGGAINLPGAQDDRVNTIALPPGDMELQRRYKFTGEARYLPEIVGTHFDSNIQPAPAGNGTYFWAQFGQHVARSQNVPVLILNAAFGGTSLEHWAKSARGEQFQHPFVNSSIRMPYIRLQHALKQYCATTGLRAILADQGQNDWPEKDEEKIAANYKTWIEQARKDAGFANLAIVVNRQSPPDGFGQIRRVQERIIKEAPYCFPGADYDTLFKEDTVDKVHLSEAGEIKAARLWADALDAKFFAAAAPMPGNASKQYDPSPPAK